MFRCGARSWSAVRASWRPGVKGSAARESWWCTVSLKYVRRDQFCLPPAGLDWKGSQGNLAGGKWGHALQLPYAGGFHSLCSDLIFFTSTGKALQKENGENWTVCFLFFVLALGRVTFLLITNLLALAFISCGWGMKGNEMPINYTMYLPRLGWKSSGTGRIHREWSKDSTCTKELYSSVLNTTFTRIMNSFFFPKKSFKTWRVHSLCRVKYLENIWSGKTRDRKEARGINT